jgi:iron complex outermembrane receptor protein
VIWVVNLVVAIPADGFLSSTQLDRAGELRCRCRHRSLAALFAACSLFAVEGVRADALSEADFLSDLPLILSATRLSQALRDTPAAMTLIDREMIRDSGAWDVADLFRLVPGMFVAYNVDKEVVPGQVVSYHGLADPYAKRMQIQIDGRSVYTPLFGGPIWSNIPLTLDDIERVEVVRGPNAASYGANSFLGVMNIITRHPSETRGSMVSLSAGKPGGEATFRHGGRSERLDYRLTLQLRGDSGYTLDPDTPKDVGVDTHPRTDNKRIGNLAFRADYQLTQRDELEFQFGYSGGSRGTGDFPVENPRREKAVASQFELLRWQRDLGPDNQFSLRVYHNRERLDEDSSQLIGNTSFPPFLLGVPAPFSAPMVHVAERMDIEAQHNFSPAENWRFVWGGGLRRDAVSSRLYLGSDDALSYRQQSIFGNVEWRPIRSLVFNLGSMLEHNSFVGTRTSPRLGANFHLTPAQTLRAAFGRAYRNPALYEQQGNERWIFPVLSPLGKGIPTALPLQYIYGQNNLRPERIDSREFGYRLELGQGSAVDVKYSYDTLTDLIESYMFNCCGTSIPGTVRTFGNRGSASVHSLEAQWQQRLGDKTRIHFGWSSTRIANNAASSAGGAYGYERSAPRTGLNALLAHPLSAQWRASLGVYRVASVHAISGDELPGYTRWDARLARQFKWPTGTGELALIVQNLGDRRYQEFYADNVWGRRAYANLRLEF